MPGGGGTAWPASCHLWLGQSVQPMEKKHMPVCKGAHYHTCLLSPDCIFFKDSSEMEEKRGFSISFLRHPLLTAVVKSREWVRWEKSAQTGVSEGMSDVPLCSAYVTKSHLQHCQPEGLKSSGIFSP